MNRLTPIVLFVVVALLGYVAYRQTEHEEANPLDEVEALFPGVEMRRVTAVRLENLRASRHLRFERDSAGRWFITDPMAWPMEPGLAEKFDLIIRRNEAAPVPDALVEEASKSFEPPYGFFETEEKLEDGSVRRVRVEVGAVDLDGIRIYVRRDGRIYRTVRNIETLLKLTLADFRARNLFSMIPSEIAEIERVGGWYGEEAQESLGMLARLDGYGWRIERPDRAMGDPTLFALWGRFLSSMRSARFATDRPDADLTRYGLESPWLTVKITSGNGVTESLHVGSRDDRVYARRGERPTIHELDPNDVVRLREPVENFYESSFARVERSRLRHVFLGRGADSLRLTLDDETWTVAANGGEEYSMELPADAGEVADLLSAIEGASVIRYFTDVATTDFFPDGPTDRGIWIETIEGIVQGGSFADPVRTPQGTELVPLLRDGDSVVGSVDPAFAARVDASFDGFLSRDLWSLSNARQRGLEIEKDGAKRSFERANEYDWRPIDASVPARELDVVLDHLLFLKAERHLPEGGRPALLDVVQVRFVEQDGTQHVARFGRTAEGEAQVAIGPLRAVLKRPALYDDLLAIISRKPDRPSPND
ncbi:MAG: DUF4340 domain-containing protein [Planctomycetota bacterium]